MLEKKSGYNTFPDKIKNYYIIYIINYYIGFILVLHLPQPTFKQAAK
jgi:hypothetical protein